jgi:uncharacterized protein (DUF1330 family)
MIPVPARLSGWLGAAAIAVAFAVGVATGSAQAARKAYVLAQVEVTNPQQYAEYAKLSPGIIASFGGRFLARAGRAATLEGPPARSRVVVIEFPSFDKAEEFYKSPAYTAARKVREGAAQAQFVVVEGVE